nr:putative integron gene cassette protein [uncultured bacterium]
MISSEIPYLKSWLMFFLVATVGGGIVGMVAGVIVGAVMTTAGMSTFQITVASALCGFVLGIPISFFTFKWAVGRFIVTPLVNAQSRVPA